MRAAKKRAGEAEELHRSAEELERAGGEGEAVASTKAVAPHYLSAERGFTVRALILNALAARGEMSARDLQDTITEIGGGCAIGASAVFAAARSLAADGLVRTARQARSAGGGPPVLVYALTEMGKAAAVRMRAQAERFLRAGE